MSFFDQRRHERYESPGDKVEYVLEPFSEDPIFEGSVIDISETGLCIFSANSLSVGQEITIKNLTTLPSRTAVVIWVEKYDEIDYPEKSDQVLFKIGLRFL